MEGGGSWWKLVEAGGSWWKLVDDDVCRRPLVEVRGAGAHLEHEALRMHERWSRRSRALVTVEIREGARERALEDVREG